MKKFKQQFGGKITDALKSRYSKSTQWKGDKFENSEVTTMSINFQTLPKLLYKQFCEKKGREPISKLPIIPFNKEKFLEPSDHAKFIWYGHSVVLLRIRNKTLLIDPMLGSDASPIAPFSTKRFSENTLSLIDDFPEIDLLLLTHDHYDHLDFDSIKKLIPKVKKYYTALGVSRHLIEWGINENDITEFDWWDERTFEDIEITFTPTRHFSGRGLSDRAQSLWGGWTFKTSGENIWFSGDSGYGNHFKEIGQRLGPFDLAFMECGQYNENWHQIHMFPEESVQAASDAGAKKIMPVHWAGFALSQHTWTDPIERFSAASLKSMSNYISPPLGQLLNINNNERSDWWKQT